MRAGRFFRAVANFDLLGAEKVHDKDECHQEIRCDGNKCSSCFFDDFILPVSLFAKCLSFT